MSYELSPATRLVATHCACCGRPLVDAVSVEAGMGPTCRKRFEVSNEVPVPLNDGPYSIGVADIDAKVRKALADGDSRKAANLLTWYAACVQGTAYAALAAYRIRQLGYAKLAEAILKNVVALTVDIDPSQHVLKVKAPFSEKFLELRRMLLLKSWFDKKVKRWMVPDSPQNRRNLVTVCRTIWPNLPIVTTNGVLMADGTLVS